MLTYEDRLGRYEVRDRIGGGGFGDVYRAFDPLLQRDVALKLLHQRGSTERDLTSGSLLDSLREARTASSLNHPGILTIYDIGEHDGRPYIVMEWIEGITLRAEMKERPVKPARVAQIGSQIAAALARAHEAGIIHRDLKPENIMLRTDEVVKILDFGLAKTSSQSGAVDLRMETAQGVIPDDGSTTVDISPAVPIEGSGRIVGTPGYMSPEQALGLPVTPASDLFGLGVILYEMVTGSHPFRCDTLGETLQKLVHLDPSPPSTLTDLPAGWEEAILQLLAKHPASRPGSASDIVHLLGGGVPAEPRVRATARSRHRIERMVGRTEELRFLHEEWTQAVTGRGRVVLVSGEPGLGKTTLVESFIEQLGSRPDVLVGTGRCTERIGTGEAYLPFLEAVSQMSRSGYGALIRSIIRTKAPTWYLHLFAGAAGESSLSDMQRTLVGAGQERMRRELVDVFEEAGRSFATCLVLEDLHWADEASAELVAYLASRLENLPVLCLATFRPVELRTENPELDRILEHLQARSLARHMDLSFLTEAEVRAYLNRVFPDHRFPGSFSAWIMAKTEGNPLFMSDLLDHLAARRIILESDGYALDGSVLEVEGDIPKTTRAMAGRALDRLSEEEFRLLTVASVHGDTFDSLPVIDALSSDSVTCEKLLERLEHFHGLLTTLGHLDYPDGSISVRYKFTHVLYQNYLHGTLNPRERAAQHRRAAELLEGRWGSESVRLAPVLGDHYEIGRVPSKAVTYFLQAANTERSKFALQQAESFCDRALHLAQQLPNDERQTTELKVLEQRGQIRVSTGRFDDAVSDFERMASTATEMGNLEGQTTALCLMLTPLLYSKRDEEVGKVSEMLLSLGQGGGVDAATATARFVIGSQHNMYGRLEEGAALVEAAYQDACRLKMPEIIGAASAELASVASFQGRYDEVLRRTAEARPMVIVSQDAMFLGVTYFFEGLAHGNRGDFTRALESLLACKRMAEENNDQFWPPRLLDCLGWLYLESFDFAKVTENGKDGLELARQTGLLEPEANLAINIGLAAMELGNSEQARLSFEQAEDIFSRDDWYRWRYSQRLEIGWSDYHLRRGELDLALRHAERGAELARTTSRGKHLILAYRQLARIALSRGDIRSAEHHAKEAMTELQRTDGILAAWRVYQMMGDLHRALDQPEVARGHDAEALRLLRRMADGAPSDMRESILASAVVRTLGESVIEGSPPLG